MRRDELPVRKFKVKWRRYSPVVLKWIFALFMSSIGNFDVKFSPFQINDNRRDSTKIKTSPQKKESIISE